MENRKKGKVIYTRVNTELYERYEYLKEMAELNNCDFIKLLLDVYEKKNLKVYDCKKEMVEISHEMKKQGVNLNQVARIVNTLGADAPVRISVSELASRYSGIHELLLKLWNKVRK